MVQIVGRALSSNHLRSLYPPTCVEHSASGQLYQHQHTVYNGTLVKVTFKIVIENLGENVMFDSRSAEDPLWY